MSRKNSVEIGGQAVLEGVMMRGKSAEAIAVRDPYGNIQVESKRLEAKKSVAYKIPVLRGVLNFVSSLTDGTKIIMRSGEVFGDDAESEPTKAEKWLSEKLHIDALKLASGIGVVLGLVLAVALFIVIPTVLKNWAFSAIDMSALGAWASFIENLALGIVKVAILVGYLGAISRMKEIKRLFSYHGAEHKTIACYEAGEELTVENIRKQKRLHDRCGTNFIFIVILVSVLFYSIFFAFLEAVAGWKPSLQIYEILIRLGLLPFVAGCSYEVLKLLAKFDNPVVRVLKAPGLALQLITTKEPDDSMIEVARTAFEEVLSLQADENMPLKSFRTSVTIKNTLAKLNEINPKTWENEEILLSLLAESKRSALRPERVIYKDIADRAEKIASERAEGKKPLQYILGSANFYGYEIKTDPRALIPRFDTEILAEQAILALGGKGNGAGKRVFEPCTGSGAVAIAVQKETGATVVASDISADALSLARENAVALGANIEFVEGDLFAPADGKFDVIVINPPYIPTADIEGLDEEVKDSEPRLALDGGTDGLDVYRRIAVEYKEHLAEGGTLLMEIGIGQDTAIAELFGEVEFISDYNNPPVRRVAIIKG